MSVIHISSFTGMRPAVAPHLLEQNESQHNYNADLENGIIIPIRGAETEEKVNMHVKSMWLHDLRAVGGGEVWRCYPDRRDFAESAIAKDQYARLYMSTEDKGLFFIDKDDNEYRLGVPAPTSKIAVEDTMLRVANVSFASSTGTFSFLDDKEFILTEGLNVTFSGDNLPVDISKNKKYIVVEILVKGNGKRQYKIGDTTSSNPKEPISFSSGTGECTLEKTGTIENRVYIFTVVNKYGDESAPSLPVEITTDITASIILKNMLTPAVDDKAPISKKRIYRTATGDSGATAYFYVGEIDASETSYTDMLLGVELGEVCPSISWAEPPTDATSLVSLPNGIFAAHTQSGEVIFCEPYKPYAWALNSRFAFHGRIKKIAVSQKTVFVLADTFLHAILYEGKESVYITQLDGFSPCLSKYSIASSPFGVLWASYDGIYMVSQGMSFAQNITEKIISEQGWDDFNPKSFNSSFFDTKYIAFFIDAKNKKMALILDFGQNMQARIRLFDEWGDAIQVIPSRGNIYLSKMIGYTDTSEIKKLFGADKFSRMASWKSKKFLFSTPQSMGAIFIDFGEFEVVSKDKDITFSGGVIGASMCGQEPFGGEMSNEYPYGTPIFSVVRVYGDNKLIATRQILKAGYLRLPKSGSYTQIEVEISTLKPVRIFSIGTTIEEMR